MIFYCTSLAPGIQNGRFPQYCFVPECKRQWVDRFPRPLPGIRIVYILWSFPSRGGKSSPYCPAAGPPAPCGLSAFFRARIRLPGGCFRPPQGAESDSIGTYNPQGLKLETIGRKNLHIAKKAPATCSSRRHAIVCANKRHPPGRRRPGL